jgi:hypothetical protein
MGRGRTQIWVNNVENINFSARRLWRFPKCLQKNWLPPLFHQVFSLFFFKPVKTDRVRCLSDNGDSFGSQNGNKSSCCFGSKRISEVLFLCLACLVGWSIDQAVSGANSLSNKKQSVHNNITLFKNIPNNLFSLHTLLWKLRYKAYLMHVSVLKTNEG